MDFRGRTINVVRPQSFMRHTPSTIAQLYARTFTTIARAPRLPTAEEVRQASELTPQDHQRLALARERRARRAAQKALHVAGL